MTPFAADAREALADPQLRANLRKATTTIRGRRAERVAERDDWEDLREQGRVAKDRALNDLDRLLVQFEERVTAAGGQVHWARDAGEANALIAGLVQQAGAAEALKVKSLLTDELGLNEALAARGITVLETDLAELIVQLAGDTPSHIVVPAIHRNRSEIRDIFRRSLPGAAELDDRPESLAAAAREFLRQKFLEVEVAISGANFAVAETGTICLVESEGNGRMCTTLAHTLITVMGIEKVVATVDDLGPLLQLLARSATGERMSPYTSLWTGVTPGDGPQSFHVVLVDAGRTAVLADEEGRDALRCIRCAACLNICPVYERVGGHAYGSTYPGPIGAVLAPQLTKLQQHRDLPWASSLCGACYDVCPVKIDIPSMLVHMRGRVVAETGGERGERFAMKMLAGVLASRRRYERAQRLARLGSAPLSRDGRIEARLPGPLRGWLASRDLPAPPPASFRDWWRSNR